jgi:hypothetical protein
LYAIIPGILCLSFVILKNTGKHEIAFQYMTDDLVLLDIYQYFDTAGLLDGYTSYVKTPVCEDSLCYEVELEFYWDLLGNFTEFSLTPEKPLTKLDHIPFSKSDYEKLSRILLTKTPSFVYLRKNELVGENINEEFPEIDGISSATVVEVREDMVHGAIYTCFTLWHIANGEITFNIKEHTRKGLNEKLIRKLLSSNNVEGHYFLIENIDSRYFKLFLPEILSLAEKYRGFFIRRVIVKIPAYLLEIEVVQEFFSINFNQLEYPSQTRLIAKLKDIRLKKSTLEVLVDGIQYGNTQQNEQIIRLIIKNADSENIDILLKMYEVLRSRQIIVSDNLYMKLISLEKHYKSLKKEIRKFKRAYDKQH